MKTDQKDILLIGRIQSAHGLDGSVYVLSLSDDPERFNELKSCLLVNQKMDIINRVDLSNVRMQPKNRILLKLETSQSRTEAEALRGHFLAVERNQAIQLPPDRWFICDLIGCRVDDAHHGFLGTVADIIQGPAQDVYVVRKEGESDLLFPALKSILQCVDIPARQIRVLLPDGLFDVYRT